MSDLNHQTIRPRIVAGTEGDQFGTQWETALVDEQGQVVAGYTKQGTFHAYVTDEQLYLYAQTYIQYLTERLSGAKP